MEILQLDHAFCTSNKLNRKSKFKSSMNMTNLLDYESDFSAVVKGLGLHVKDLKSMQRGKSFLPSWVVIHDRSDGLSSLQGYD